MKPPPFDYIRPTDVAGALRALSAGGEDAKVIAGGQSLVPMLNLRLAHPTLLVDINRLDIAGISVNDGVVRIGGMTRQSALLESDVIRHAAPIIAEAARLVGHPAIRNRGTLGGSLCHADPTAELAAVALLLDARIHLESMAGGRTVGADEFFLGPFTTAILPDELLTGVSVAAQPADERFAFVELSERSGDFAVAGVAVRFSIRDGLIADSAVVLAGAAGAPLRSAAAEAVLDGAVPGEGRFGAAAEAATADLEPQADIRASAEFRRHLLRVLVARALDNATHGTPRHAH